MALSEQSRNQMYTYFAATELGEEATSEMLSYFPARDVEEPITKEFLRSELALVRLELREELHNEIGALRNELRNDVRQQFFWLMSTLLVLLGVNTTLILTLH